PFWLPSFPPFSIRFREPGTGQVCDRRKGLTPSRPSSGRKVQAWVFERDLLVQKSSSPAWHFPGALAGHLSSHHSDTVGRFVTRKCGPSGDSGSDIRIASHPLTINPCGS